jgi:hypothetical protein
VGGKAQALAGAVPNRESAAQARETMSRKRKPYIAGELEDEPRPEPGPRPDQETIKGRIGDGTDREVAVFCPAIYLADVSAVAQGSPLGVGVQNIHYEKEGPFTGELAARMLREGPERDRTLVGHSERRHYFHEPDEWMARRSARPRQRPAADPVHRRDDRGTPRATGRTAC